MFSEDDRVRTYESTKENEMRREKGRPVENDR